MPIVGALYQIGKPAWIAIMILGFAVWWPLGLASLAFIIGSRKMGCWNHAGADHWQQKMDRMRGKMGQGSDWWGQSRSSGNRAFDEYRTETLRRLEDEQREFRDFLERLRQAKDKAEFDQFMTDRRNRPPQADHPAPQPQG